MSEVKTAETASVTTRVHNFVLNAAQGDMIGCALRASNVLGEHQLIEIANHKFWEADVSVGIRVAAAEGAAGSVRVWWLPQDAMRTWDVRYNHTYAMVNENTRVASLALPEMDYRETSADVVFGNVCCQPEAFLSEATTVSCSLTITVKNLKCYFKRPGLHNPIAMSGVDVRSMNMQANPAQQVIRRNASARA